MAKILKYKFMKKRSEQSISIMSIICIFVKVYEFENGCILRKDEDGSNQ